MLKCATNLQNIHPLRGRKRVLNIELKLKHCNIIYEIFTPYGDENYTLALPHTFALPYIYETFTPHGDENP